MLVNFIKFIHLLCVLGLLSSAIYCMTSISLKKSKEKFFHLNKLMLFLGLLAILTGSLLVHPKHFTFHTPWIKAAYLLVIGFCIGIGSLFWLQKIMRQQWIMRIIYSLLIVLLVLTIHDAVTKTTFIF